MEERVTDQLRKLTNSITLSGKLMRLSPMITGTNKNGVDFLMFNGAIKCDPNVESQYVNFNVSANAKTAKGADNKIYANMKKWYSTAVADEKDPGNGTMVCMSGTIEDNPYVNSEGTLVQGVRYRMSYINNFEKYGATINLEGFIASIYDEEIKRKGEEESVFTGRQCMRLISKDYSNLIDIRKIIIPAELVEPMQANGYVQGATALFYIKLAYDSHNEGVAATGGIGDAAQHVAAFLRREYVLTGANPVIDEDSERAIPKKLIEKAINERNARLETIVAEGYKGKKETAAIGVANQVSPIHEPILDDADDDDMPF